MKTAQQRTHTGRGRPRLDNVRIECSVPRVVLDKLVRERRIAMLYITHDLLSARLLSDEILVLNQGQVVEQGPAARVIRQPEDEYTRLLLAAIPRLEGPGTEKGLIPTAEPVKVHR